MTKITMYNGGPMGESDMASLSERRGREFESRSEHISSSHTRAATNIFQ